MANYIRALMMPDGTSVLISLIAQAAMFEGGVGVLGERGNMLGWIPIVTQDEALRSEHFSQVLQILNDIINHPRRSVQPDWSFLDEA